MAVMSTALDSILVIRYQTGVSASGSPLLRQKSLAGVKANAADQDVYDVAAALFSLLQYPLIEVRRDNRFDLVSQ
ncbi:MAG: DUF1659 domain-containing protein [Peptococcaceae bacterium]|nr:DUF1659 domain-containing protein [Peptococcaceae bacterium]